MKGSLGLIAAFLLALAGAVGAQEELTPPPPQGYVGVSELVELPEFIPGVGALYVHPDNAPVGPWLSYGNDGRLVEVLLMFPLGEMQGATDWTNLATGTLDGLGIGPIDHVDMTYNGGHPGMAEPHYHVRLVLVDDATQGAALTE